MECAAMLMYVCEACRFMFESETKAERCPDCGSPRIRAASLQETHEFQKTREELQREAWWLEEPHSLWRQVR